MTSQSPFPNNTNTSFSGNLEKFPLRTMQDDLLNLKSGGGIVSENRTVPTPTTQPKPITPTPFGGAAQEVPRPTNTINSTIPIQKDPVKIETQQKIVEIPTTQVKNDVTPPKSISYKIIMSIIIVLIISIIGLSGYYFWMKTSKTEIPVAIEPPTEVTPVVTPVATVEPVIVAPVEKYSQNKANYLPIDLTVSPDLNVQTALSSAANERKQTKSQVPYEFIIVDSNNNPISFSNFASAAKMTLNPTLISALSNTFSIFLYNDNQTIKAGITIEIRDKNLVTTELEKQEKTFIPSLTPLFLGEKAETLTGSFGASTYNNIAVKYLNVNAAKNLSIDYAILNSQLAIGTSKNTLRGIIDKISSKQSTTVDEL